MFEIWKREGETSRSQPMCWQLNLAFWKNRSVRFARLKHPVFTVIRWSIFLYGVELYIFHKLDHTNMFLRLCMYFSNNLDEFHSRNKEVVQKTRIWLQTEDLKPPWWSSHWDHQNGYMEHIVWSSDEEVMTFWRYSRLKN
jgi:hypothetical protein